MTDPIADMLTRIRNALSIRAKTVSIPHSQVKEDIVKVMQTAGYINTYEVSAEPKSLVVTLKYVQGKPALNHLKRISKPGRRLYSPAKKLPISLGGYGSFIITTSQGIMTDREARAHHTGGEIICEIY